MSGLADDEPLKELGARVRSERTRLGWRQADLAERLGLPRSRIARIENGTRERVTYLELLALARALGVGVAYLTVEADHPLHGLLRSPQPKFEQRHLVGLAAAGLAGRLLHDQPGDPAELEDMARALLHCQGEPVSRAVLETWLEQVTKPQDP